MILSRKEAQELDREALFRFVELKMPEGAQLDYKVALSNGSRDEAYREFLKDVTGFANATGGLILIGVKEPEDHQPPEEQVIGIQNGGDLSRNLERLAATSIDPRIPGLTVNPIEIDHNRHVILVYIPPTFIKPHMVIHKKHRTFYIRHSESCVPMTTHELRETVLASATSEARALSYAQEQEADAVKYLLHGRPGFLLQAVPLLRFETPWDTLDPIIISIFQGEDRTSRYNMGLQALTRPSPTINGIAAWESRDSESWFTEAHRNGFIQAVFCDIDYEIFNGQGYFVLHKNYVDLFRSFTSLCNALWDATQSDCPYLFRAKYFEASNTV